MSKAREESPAGTAALRADAARAPPIDVVDAQVEAGLDIVNDGEFGKSSWANYVARAADRLRARPDRTMRRCGSAAIAFASASSWRPSSRAAPTACPGTSASDRSPTVATTRFAATSPTLKAALAAAGVEEGFLTAVAPASTGYDASNEYYTRRSRLRLRDRRRAARGVSRDRQRRPDPAG